MKFTTCVAALLSVAAFNVFAAQLPQPKSVDLDVVDYHYGEYMDVAELNSVKKSNETFGVVMVVMTYEDHKGGIHQVRFLEISECNNCSG